MYLDRLIIYETYLVYSSFAMADLPSSTYKDVWKAIASILHQSVDLSQTLFSAEEFAGILNTHVVSRDSVDAISDDLIKASLSNGIDKEYSIPLNCLPLLLLFSLTGIQL